MKVVINNCFGGFGLSHKAVMRYAEIKGITLYSKDSHLGFNSYSTVPQEEYDRLEAFCRSKKPGIGRFTEVNAVSFSERDIARDDPALIQVIKELGEKANGMCASLKIVNIPKDAKWHIHEYDGSEQVAENHRTWG